MGQRRQQRDDDNHDISDMSSADQRPDTDAAAKKKLLQKIKLSGNFHTYREMKLKQLQEKRSDDTTVPASTTDNDGGQSSKNDDDSWNHFITPLKPIMSPAATITSEETMNTIKEEETTTTQTQKKQKSMFSDLERTQTIDRFGHIFMNQMGNVMSSGKLTSAWGSNGNDDGRKSQRSSTSMFSWLFVDYSPNAIKKQQQHDEEREIVNPNDYAAERRMITPHLTPFVWGTSCVVVTLASIRLGRWYQGRMIGRAATSSSSSSSLYNRSNRTTSAIERNRLHDLRSNKSTQGYGQYNDNMNMGNHPSSYQKNALLSNLSTLPVDLAISLLVGISTSIFLTRPEDLLQDVSKAPLLPGKSVLREELCVPFTQEMDIINRGYHTYTGADEKKQIVSFQDIWKDENIGDFATLKAIRDFVANCHRA